MLGEARASASSRYRRRRWLLRAAVAAVGAGVITPSMTVCADTWDNNTATVSQRGSWSIAANWADNTEPVLSPDGLSGDAVILPAGFPNGATSIRMASGEVALSLTFADSYALIGVSPLVGSLRLGGVGEINTLARGAQIDVPVSGVGGLTKTGTGSVFLNAANTFTGAVAINAGELIIDADAALGNAANDVTLNGGALLTNGASFSSSRTVTVASASRMTVPVDSMFTLTTGLSAGAGTLLADGEGTLELAGPSARSAATQVQTGTIRASNSTALGSGAITVSSGGALEVAAGAAVAQALALSGSGAVRGIGTSSYVGTITVGAATSVALQSGASSSDLLTVGDGPNDYTGGAGTLTIVNGSGVVSMPHSNNYAGTWRIDSGALRVGNASSLGPAASPVIIGAAGALDVAGISYGHDVSVVSGSTIRGSGGAATWTSALSVPIGINVNLATAAAGDVFTFGDSANDLTGGGATSTITIAGPGKVALTQSSNVTADWFINAGSTLAISADDQLGNANNVTINGGKLEVSGTVLTARTIVPGGGGAEVNASGSFQLFQPIAANANSLTAAGTGTFVVNATSLRTGTTSIRNGTLRLNHVSGLGTGAVTLESGVLELGNSISPTMPLTMLSGATLRNLTAGSPMYAGAITVAAGANPITIESGTVPTSFFAIPTYGGGVGAKTIITGGGVVTLPNATTYAGDWQIDSGALSLLNASSLGTGTSAVVVNNGAVLQLTNGATLARDVTLNAGATLRSSNNGTTAGVVTIAAGAAVTIGGSNTGTFTLGDSPNDLTGGNGGSTIAMNAIGTLVLNQPSDYVGNWNINFGALEFDGDNRIGDIGNQIAINNATLRATATFASSRTITLGAGSGTIEVSGSNTLTHNGFINGGTALLFKAGTGKLVLQTNGSSRTGATFINAGTLALGVSTGAGSGEITNSATLELINTGIGNALTMNNNSVVRGTGAGAALTGPVSVSGNAVTFTPGIDANDVLRLPGIANQLSGTAGAVINIGEGVPVAGKVIAANSSSSSYFGGWNVNGATLRVEQIQALGGGVTPVNVNSGVLELATGFGRSITLHNGATLRGTGSGSSTGTITVGAGDAVTLASGASASDNLEITGPTNLIGGTGGSTITVAGSGTVFLSGPSSWTGEWIVNSTLRPNADDRLGNALNNVKLINGRLLAGASFATARNFTVDNGTIELFGGLTLTISGSVTSSGAGTFTKAGPGTLVLAGGQSITGATTVTGGTLRLEQDWVTTAPVTATTATLELANGADIASPITLNNFGTLRSSGSGSIAGGVNTVASGVSVTFNTVGAGSDLSVGDAVNELTGGGVGSVINVTGPGKVVLGAANNYTGSWVVQNGSTLEIGASANLGSAANTLALQGGKLSFTGSSGSMARPISALGGSGISVTNAGTTLTLSSSLTTSGGATINKTGPGTLAISGTQTYGVGTTMNISDGAVALNSAAGSATTRRLSVNVTTPGASLTMNTLQHLSALNVSGGGTARLSAGFTTVLATNNLTVTGVGSKFDVFDNKVIVSGANIGTRVGGTYSGLTGLIQSAYDFGAWDGNGMTTSVPEALTGVTGLGITTADANGFAGSVWGGVSVNSGDVLVMYTYAGDANLDGTIDGGDYGIIDNFIQVAGAFGYGNGDFNYDGTIDGGDYGIIDNNIQAQGAPFPISPSVGLSAVTMVPEPAACAFAILTACLLRRRGRRVTLPR